MNRLLILACFAFCLVADAAAFPSGSATAKSLHLESEGFRLEFVPHGSGYGLCIRSGKERWFAQPCPAVLAVYNVADDGGMSRGQEYRLPYGQVVPTDSGLVARCRVQTREGAVVRLEDCYKASDGAFVLSRTVQVCRGAAARQGFTSHFVLDACPAGASSSGYEYFLPSILYRDTACMAPRAIAADLGVPRLLVKETRMGLPLALLRHRENGRQLALLHLPELSADGCPGGGAPGIASPGTRYGSLGYGLRAGVSVEFCYPSCEGPRSYEPRRSRPGDGSGWVSRCHPLAEGVAQRYSLVLMPGCLPTFNDGLTAACLQAFERLPKEHVVVDQEQVYADNLRVFCREFRQYGAGAMQAAGLPWSLDLIDGSAREGVSFQMGFVGQQIPIGYYLFRHGLEHRDTATAAKGKAMLDFWTSPRVMHDYFPTVWWDPADDATAGRRRDYPSFLRCMVDGMEGLLDACRTAAAYGCPQPQWEQALRKVASHLVAKQQPDGSFCRAYRTDGTVETGGGAVVQGGSKLNTPVAVRFLAKMYEHTGDAAYRRSALAAAAFAYRTLYLERGKYVGGTPDNPNTVDKEAAVFALYAFNAAYQLGGGKKYLRAAAHAACCALSWTYCYDFAVPSGQDGEGVKNPFRQGGTSGFSLIATGHSGADNFMAFAYYEVYKLYVATGCRAFREMALFLQNHTKQCTDFDGRLGYRYRAFMPEATTVADFSFRSVGLWLPWSGVANVEPVVQMRDTFGSSDIARLADRLPRLRRQLRAYGCGGRPMRPVHAAARKQAGGGE